MEIYHESRHNEDMEPTTSHTEWDFFDYDGAIFRRPKGNIGGVTHVFLENERVWRRYEGEDKTTPWCFGDRTLDPLRDTA